VTVRERSAVRARTTPRPALTPGLGAAALCLLFIAASARFVALDERVPDFDTGKHLLHSFNYASALRSGDLVGPFEIFTDYPPVGHLVGALGALVGGDTHGAPILALNLIFVPLLVLSVYRAGTLLADRRIGLLAVVFVLGAPLLSSQFHTYYLEAPATALAAAAIWLMLESDRFARWKPSLAAGVVVGFGLLTKQVFPFFVAGFVLVMLVRGGWRNWRGFVPFGVAAVVIAAPWYLAHLHDLDASLKYAEVAPDPPRWSAKNAAWFGWVQVNWQLLLPLSLLLATGAVVSARRWVRSRDPRDYTPELIALLVVAYVGLTYSMGLHAVYYLLPILPAQALLATVWFASLSARRFRLAATGLAVVAAVNFAAVNFMGGGRVGVEVGPQGAATNKARYITLYSDGDWMTGPPVTDGPVPDIMRAARRDGIATMEFDVVDRPDFNATGLTALAHIEGIRRPSAWAPAKLGPREAFMTARTVEPGLPAPCGKLEDGTGVYLILGNGARPVSDYRYCPTR
jgi:4-amino-4-deoxy-L-arabinose transferase-like glycosyltransferase